MLLLLLALVLPPRAARQLDALAKKAAGNGCPANARLDRTIALGAGSVIGVYSLSTHPFPENGCAPGYRNAWVAVTIQRGVAHVSSLHDGEPQQLGLGPDGTLWLYALWTVESGKPLLWRTTDGKDWREVRLPMMRAGRQYSETVSRIGLRTREILMERLGVADDVLECWRLAPRVSFLGKGPCGVLQPLLHATQHP
jgi:hypothetical protein